MKDSIDDRNEKEKISKSIIKYWNVNYKPAAFYSETDGQAQEVLNRLKEEADADEAKLQEELSAAMREAELRGRKYNASTNSYSGTYGNESVSDVTKGQIDKILREKSDAIRHIVEQRGEEGTK